MKITKIFAAGVKHLALYIICFSIAAALFSVVEFIPHLVKTGEIYKHWRFIDTFGYILPGLIFVAPMGLAPHALILYVIKKFTVRSWSNYAIGGIILPIATYIQIIVFPWVTIAYILIFMAIYQGYFPSLSSFFARILPIILRIGAGILLIIVIMTIIYHKDHLAIILFFPIVGAMMGTLYWYLEKLCSKSQEPKIKVENKSKN